MMKNAPPRYKGQCAGLTGTKRFWLFKQPQFERLDGKKWPSTRNVAYGLVAGAGIKPLLGV
jgi:hypothetical protein